MGVKILIIEDNPQDQKIFQRYLIRAGYAQVLLAANGEEGLALAVKERPQIVVTDTNLPGMDGFEICRRVKAIDGLNARVIVMTGQVDAVDAGKAREHGADDYCVKTSDCAPLIAAVKNLDIPSS